MYFIVAKEHYCSIIVFGRVGTIKFILIILLKITVRLIFITQSSIQIFSILKNIITNTVLITSVFIEAINGIRKIIYESIPV